jgi:hypothetical protein
VPLYLACVFILVAAGLSFMGGRKLTQPERSAAENTEFVQDSLAAAAINQSWYYAPRDVL